MKKMSELELRMWCMDKAMSNGFFGTEVADMIYDYVTKGQKEVQKKPREHFSCRLLSWIHDRLK